MKKPENWTLTKVKKMKNGGIEGSFSNTKMEKGITNAEEWNFKNTENPHPDLTERMDQLKVYLTKCYGMDSVVILSNSKGLTAGAEQSFKKVKNLVDGAYQQILNKIDINGLSISGTKEDDKDNRSVVIIGTQLMENGSKCAINSPKIKLSLNTFSFEDELEEIVDAIEDEVAAYIYEGKKAQLDMFGGETIISEDFKKGNLKAVKEEEEAA